MSPIPSSIACLSLFLLTISTLVSATVIPTERGHCSSNAECMRRGLPLLRPRIINRRTAQGTLYETLGSQSLTLTAGDYLFAVWGGSGGDATSESVPGGTAANINNTHTFEVDTEITLVVGGKGFDDNHDDGAGGGGGSFVYIANADISQSIPIVIAGGGGGAAYYNAAGADASLTTSGTPGTDGTSDDGNGGTAGNSGGSATDSAAGGAGAGFYSADGTNPTSQQGSPGSTQPTFAGGNSDIADGDGAYGGVGGGGGGGNVGGGGGGGYSGGGAGNDSNGPSGGGGGGSYPANAQSAAIGWVGNGKIYIYGPM